MYSCETVGKGADVSIEIYELLLLFSIISSWQNRGFCSYKIVLIKKRVYLGIVFESLKNIIQIFERLKNFRRFRVFVLSYRGSSKRRKRQKVAN